MSQSMGLQYRPLQVIAILGVQATHRAETILEGLIDVDL